MPKTPERRTQLNESKGSKQEWALRAVQMTAVSGFVEDSRSLQESGLDICNSCREYVPWPFLRVAGRVPSTLLAGFLPDVLSAEGESDSRVLLPRKVLKVNWTFDDPATASLVRGGERGDEVDGEEEGNKKEEEEEVWQLALDYEIERNPVTTCDIDMSKVRWPEGVQEIYLWGFNRCIDEVVWPVGLEVLSFHMPLSGFQKAFDVYGMMGIFNKPLDRVTFPPGLREICLGHDFNQPIDNVAWPECLERLSMPSFNHPIEDVQWPSGLTRLDFMQPYEFEIEESTEEGLSFERRTVGFNRPLDTFLPMSLTILWLSNCFDQPLRGVTWPTGLDVLGLGAWLTTESMDGAEWPPSLRKLVLSSCRDVENPPPGCKVIYIGLRFNVSEIEHDIKGDVDPWDYVGESDDTDSLDDDSSLELWTLANDQENDDC